MDPQGAPHIIKRTLDRDYAKKHACESSLEINGRPAARQDLEKLGIKLSEPPLSTPVLMQHTLGYVFSAKPQERSLYFKALLEVTDLDDFRSTVAEADSFLESTADEHVQKVERCTAAPQLAQLFRLQLKLGGLDTALPFSAAAADILSAARETPAVQGTERFDRVAELLEERRAKTFPLRGFNHQPLPEWDVTRQAASNEIDAFTTKLREVDKETKRLTKLFEEVLKIPEVAGAMQPLDCPVCGTKDALTPERVDFIRSEQTQTTEFREAQTKAEDALRQLASSACSLERGCATALPQACTSTRAERLNNGFRLDKMRNLLEQSDRALIGAWTQGLRPLLHSSRSLRQAVARASALASEAQSQLSLLKDTTELKKALATVAPLREAFANLLDNSMASQTQLRDALQAAVDRRSDTEGWQDFVELARNQDVVRTAFVESHARETVRKELRKALRQIDAAKEQVLDAKFADLSAEIAIWWEALRPNEPTFFECVSLRPGGRRNIDFKAALSPGLDRSNPQIRDVVAVFSQSQLHCLGLAAFLARATRERAGFVFLDEPVLSGDEDHRAYFVAHVVQALFDRGIQIVVLTQDEGTRKNLQERYSHAGVDVYRLTMPDPGSGPDAVKTSDDLAIMLSNIKPLVSRPEPEHRRRAAEEIRNAAERFCKHLLVNARRATSDTKAVLTDYNGWELGKLIAEVIPLLQDRADRGKLQMIRQNTNPGKHDDDTPSSGDLGVALGDLVRLKKVHLPG